MPERPVHGGPRLENPPSTKQDQQVARHVRAPGHGWLRRPGGLFCPEAPTIEAIPPPHGPWRRGAVLGIECEDWPQLPRRREAGPELTQARQP